MKLIKILYYSDKEHLNKYGRFICGGWYVAMPYGPVNSPMLDLIDHDPEGHIECGSNNLVTSRIGINYKKLSKSDREILLSYIEKYCYKTGGELSDMTHKDPLWEELYGQGGRGNNPIPTERYIEDPEFKEFWSNHKKESHAFKTWLKKDEKTKPTKSFL